MRVILKEDYLKLPDDGKSIYLLSSPLFLSVIVTVSVKARRVTVEGPKGKLTKNLSHLPIDIRVVKMATAKMKGKYVRI